MRRQRGLLFALLLALPALAFSPRAGFAQDGPGEVHAAVALVLQTLSYGAHTAAVAFRGEQAGPAAQDRHGAEVSGAVRTRRALAAVGGMAVIGFILALVVLVTAQEALEAVAVVAEKSISASFWMGLLGQVLAVPLLLTVSILLAITIILIPAIPIAMLAWALAYAGAFTLGLYGVAVVLGRAVLGRSAAQDRSALLASLMCGMIMMTLVWIVAAALVSVPVAGIVARLIALAFTWAAATVGLGSVVRSRGGTRRKRVDITTETGLPLWQTPTPVFGVVAARRPTPVGSLPPE